MKKRIYALSLLIALLLTGCGDGQAATAPAETAVPTVETSAPTTAETTVSAPETTEAIQAAGGMDLSAMSTTMAMAQLTAMQYEPESYLGQTIKMRGTFAVGYGETRNYYYCLIADATACCQQGLEFLWEGHTFPDDYPEPGAEIIVEGVFDTYLEDNYTYMQLINASMEPA